MTKNERISLLNKALEIYTSQTISLIKLQEKLGIGKNSISKFLKEHGIEIKEFHNEKSDLDLAVEELKKSTIEEVSNSFGISKEALILATSGLSKSEYKKKLIQLAVEEYINTPRLDKSVAAISKKFGINKKTLRKYLKEKNIKIENTGSAVSFNENIFHKIDTEEKAYWLGFLYAGGYINSNNHGVGLNLSYKDINHLEKFNNFLNYSKGMIVSKTHQFGSKSCKNIKDEDLYMVCTKITNVNLWTDLNKAGCVPNKSLILTFPDDSILPKELIRHFIRGYFDGDGTLGLYQHSKSNPTLEESLIFVGTKPFLEKVQEYLGKGFLMQKKNCNELTYRLSYSTTKANKAARIMYDNSNIYLERKYNIYLKYLCRRKIE